MLKHLLLGLIFIAGTAMGQAPGQRSAVIASDCDYACLIDFVRGYMRALAGKDTTQVRFAPDVRFTENNVAMPLGNEGLWATISGVPQSGLEAADVTTGEAAWMGAVEEHGLPVYFGARLKVRDRAIVEVETVVVRTTGLPLPFGDVKKLVHDPAFAQVLPPEQRRPRERLIAVADSYFSTVELNDGLLFVPFEEDCARLENGVLTTSAASIAGSISPGCEAQLKLGLYRINKRIRERRYPLVDVERGVVVATTFFDHANEFDTYLSTDGVQRKTLLKWPNSISLMEAFKIRNGRVHRIEAVFTYVPYFMHSPFHTPPPLQTPSRPVSEPAAEPCDRDCLIALADRYMDGLARRDATGLPWASEVRFTENSVPLMMGEGLWGSIRGKSDRALRVADPQTGNVVWLGVVIEHDAPAYYGMRMKVANRRIAEVESVVARARNPGPFGDPARFDLDRSLLERVSEAARTPRGRMIDLVDGYASSMQLNDGTLFTQFAADCERRENGLSVTHGDAGAAVIAKGAAKIARGCRAQLERGLYLPVERVRDRRIAVVDEVNGIVVASRFADHPVRRTTYRTVDGKQHELQDRYPSTRELFEVYKIHDGRIQRIEALSVFQPYRMPAAYP